MSLVPIRITVGSFRECAFLKQHTTEQQIRHKQANGANNPANKRGEQEKKKE
jgi:hypothetical protein